MTHDVDVDWHWICISLQFQSFWIMLIISEQTFYSNYDIIVMDRMQFKTVTASRTKHSAL